MASALDTVRAGIEGQIQTLWNNRTPVRWADRPFDAPNSGNWLAVDIIWGSADVVTMGGAARKNWVVGVLNLNLFGPVAKGFGALYRDADVAREMVNDLVVSGVMFDAPSGPVVVPDTEGRGKWKQINVSASFRVEETAP